jgi:hypothetical protein
MNSASPSRSSAGPQGSSAKTGARAKGSTAGAASPPSESSVKMLAIAGSAITRTPGHPLMTRKLSALLCSRFNTVVGPDNGSIRTEVPGAGLGEGTAIAFVVGCACTDPISPNLDPLPRTAGLSQRAHIADRIKTSGPGHGSMLPCVTIGPLRPSRKPRQSSSAPPYANYPRAQPRGPAGRINCGAPNWSPDSRPDQ